MPEYGSGGYKPPTWGDTAQQFEYGSYGLLESLLAEVSEYADPTTAARLAPSRRSLKESQATQLEEMTPAGREQFQSQLGSPEFYRSPTGWAFAQLIGSSPYLLASVVPTVLTGGWGGLAVAGVTGGVLTDAQLSSAAQESVDKKSHKELSEMNPQYADDIMSGKTEAEARARLKQTIVGPGAHLTALALGAASSLLGAPRAIAGAAGRGVAAATPKGGVVSTAAKETVLGGGAEFVEEGGTDVLTQQAEIGQGLRKEFDPGQALRAGLTGAIIGAPIGTAAGAIEGIRRPGDKTTAEPAKPSTEVDPAVEVAARGQPVVPATGPAPVTPPVKPSAIPVTTAASGVVGGTVPAVGAPTPTGAPGRAGAPIPASPSPLTGGAIPTLSSKVTKLADPLAPAPDVSLALAAKAPPAPQAGPTATPPARVPPMQPTPSPAAVPPARVPPQQPVPAGEQVQAGLPPLKTNVPPAGNVPPTNVPPAGPVPAPQNRTPEAVQAGLPPLRTNVPPAAPVPAANVPPMQPVPQGAPVPAARVPPAQPIPAPGQPVVPQRAPLAQQPIPIAPVPAVGQAAPAPTQRAETVETRSAIQRAMEQAAAREDAKLAEFNAPLEEVVAAPVPVPVAPEKRGPRVLEAIQTAEEKRATRRALAQERLERIKTNQRKRAPLGPEETAALHEAQIETGKIGPAAKAKKASDKAGAKKLFNKHAPAADAVETDAEVKARVNAIVDEANKTGTKIPGRIRVSTDEQAWLKDAADLKKAFDKGSASKDHIQTFTYRERALKTGDAGPLREGRKTEGTEKSAKAQEYREEAGEGKPATPVVSEEITAEETLDELAEERGQGVSEARTKTESQKTKQLTRAELREKLIAEEKAKHAPKTAEAVAKSKEPDVTSESKPKPSKPVEVVTKAKPKLPLKMRFKEALRRLDRNPTAAELAAGNARTAQVSWNGLDLVVTRLKGWMTLGTEQMAHRGHIRGTRSADGRPIDVFIGPNIDSTNVFVVDQVSQDTGQFVDHKALIGFDSHADAVLAYQQSIGNVQIGDITPMTVEEFKTWAKDKEVTTEPVGEPDVAAMAQEVGELEIGPAAPLPSTWKYKLENEWKIVPQSLDGLLNTLGVHPLIHAEGSADILQGMAARILNHVGDVPVYFVPRSQLRQLTSAPAVYKSSEHIILMSDEYRTNPVHRRAFPRTLIHEGVHAAFLKALYQNDSLRGTVTDIARELMYALDSAGLSNEFYAFKNVDEFVAEALSNKTMQAWLAKVPASKALQKALVDAKAKPFGKPIRTLWQALRKIISTALGYRGTETENTLLDAMMEAATEAELTLESNKPGALTTADILDRRLQSQFALFAPGSPWNNEAAGMAFSSPRDYSPEAAGFQFSDFKKVGEYLPENYRPREGTFQTRVLMLDKRSMDGLAQLAKDFGATFGKHVRNLYNAIQELHTRQGDLFRQSEKFVIEVIEAKKKFKGEQWDRFAAYLNRETEAGVYGDRALEDQPHLGKDGGKNVLTAVNARSKHAGLAAEWAQLDPELQALRNKMLSHFKGQYEGAAQEILENIIIRLTGKEDNALAKKIFDKEDLTTDELTQLGDTKELINHIRHTRELGKIKGPYYPLMRIGQFVASGTYKFDAPTDATVVKDTQNTFEFSGDKARERAIAYANKQNNYVRVMKTWVDPTTGEVFFEDVNEEGTPIQVKAGPTIPEAEARYRVFVQDQYTEFFDTLKDAQVMDFELRKDASYTPSHLGPRQFNPFEQSKRGIMSNEINQLLDTMYKRPEFNQMTDTAKMDLEKALRELSLRMHGSTRIQARGLPRRMVMGASRDVVNVSLQHAEAMAGYRAKLQMQRHIDSARDAMQEAVSTDEGGGQKSWAAREAISNEMVDRTTRIQTQAPPSKLDQNINRVTAVSFVHYLMSPAYSINNFMQVTMLAYPQLAARYGSGTAIRLLMKAYKDMGVLKVLKAGFKETARAAKGGVKVRHNFLTEVLAGIHDPGEKAMLEHLRKTGSITPESGLEIDRMINGGNFDKAIDYFQGMARAMPAAIETINRVTVGLTAYRAEMKKSGDVEKATLAAQEMVNLTQGNYSAANMPAFFNHPLGRLALQFKKYGFTVYGQLGHNIGLILRNANPGDRAEGAKALTMLAATHVIMAGALGLPTEPIRWLVTGANATGLTEANWDDVENWVREMGADALGSIGGELLTRGIPRMFGIDLSERLGSQNLLTHGIPQSNDEYGLYAFMGELLSGAPVAMGMDIKDGFNDILNGDFVEGASKAVPMKVFRDSIKSYTMATEGKKTPAGYEVLPPSGIVDTILGGLGYRTAKAAEVQERRSYIGSVQARTSEKRNELQREWHAATPNERLKVWGRIEQFNRTQSPEAKLTRAMVQDYSKRKKSEDVDAGFRVTRTNRDLIRRTQGTYVTN